VVLDKTYYGISCKEFFEQYILDSGPNSFSKYFIERGENNVKVAYDFIVPDPPEDYEGKPVLLISSVSAEFNLDSIFVKVSPNVKTMRIIE
jgi:hypothetical protein